jgi:transposase
MGKAEKKRRVYPKECKIEAVALAEKGEKPVIQVARDLGISDTVLHRWMQVSREAKGEGVQPFLGHGRPRDEEPARLRKEVKALRTANEILKKAAVIFAQGEPPVTAYRFIPQNRAWYAVREMAGLLGVSSSAYYRWAKYGVSPRWNEADAGLVDLIHRIQERHH